MGSPTRFAKIEEQIIAGNFSEAHSQLNKLRPSELPYPDMIKFANLARRAGLFEVSIRSIRSLIRGDDIPKLSAPLQAQVAAEYGASLLQVGAISESWQLLAKSASQNPTARFYQGIWCLRTWDLEQAYTIFSELQENSSSYPAMVNQLNLIASAVALEKFAAAQENIELLESHLRTGTYPLLESNLVELKAQFYFGQRKLQAAQQLVDALPLKDASHPLYSVYHKKWSLLIKAYSDPGHVLESLKALRDLATARSDWELGREIDFHEAILTGDQQKFENVYLGSSSVNYRQRISKYFPSFTGPVSAAVHVTGMGQGLPSIQPSAERFFDLFLATSSKDKENRAFSLGSLLHLYLVQLTGDFYKVHLRGSLFEKLYPGEYYSYEVAKARFENLQYRLNKLSKESDFGFRILEINKGYKIAIDPQWTLKIDTELLVDPPNDQNSFRVRYLQRTLGAKSFASEDVQKILDCKKTQATEFLATAVELGHISKSRDNRKFVYEFTPSKPKVSE